MGHPVIAYGYLVVELLLIVAVAAVGRKLQQTGGLLAWKGKPVRVFSKNANYNMLYLSCAVAVLVQGAALGPGVPDGALWRGDRVAAGHGGLLHGPFDVSVTARRVRPVPPLGGRAFFIRQRPNKAGRS